jgi:hypothetical protein
MAAKDRHIAAPYPAWSAIGVSQLITEGALVEIRAIAVDPRSRGGWCDATPAQRAAVPPIAED